MLFCKHTFEYVSNYTVFYFKKIYKSYWNKKRKNSNNFFLIIVNENLWYLKIWSLFQLTFQKVIQYPGMSWCQFLKQTSLFTRLFTWCSESNLITTSQSTRQRKTFKLYLLKEFDQYLGKFTRTLKSRHKLQLTTKNIKKGNRLLFRLLFKFKRVQIPGKCTPFSLVYSDH